MTAKEVVIEHAPDWSEEQAKRALQAAEGGESLPRDARARDDHSALMERAAALRARQTKVVDAAALVREARGDLERRGS